MPLYTTSYRSLRVFMPVQRPRCAWATTSPLHCPPQQAAEDHPCIPAPTTAAYRLWAGEHRKPMELVMFQWLSGLPEERRRPQSVKQNIQLKHLCVQRAVCVFVIYMFVIFTRKHKAGMDTHSERQTYSRLNSQQRSYWF